MHRKGKEREPPPRIPSFLEWIMETTADGMAAGVLKAPVPPMAFAALADGRGIISPLSPLMAAGQAGKDVVEHLLVHFVCKGAVEIVLLTEAYVLRNEGKGSEIPEDVERLARQDRLHEHPDAIDTVCAMYFHEGGEVHAWAPISVRGDDGGSCELGKWEVHYCSKGSGRFSRIFAKARGDAEMESGGRLEELA